MNEVQEKADMRIRKGYARVLYAFDAAWEIDIAQLVANRGSFGQDWKDVEAFQSAASERGSFKYDVQPRIFRIPSPELEIEKQKTSKFTTVTILDAGAISIEFQLPLENVGLDELVQISASIHNSGVLREEAQRLAELVLKAIEPWTEKPYLSPECEDYATFVLEQLSEGDGPQLFKHHALKLAQILLGETDDLSEERIEETLEFNASYHPDDVAIFDWRGALCVGSGWEDVVSVLTLANVELLELKNIRSLLKEREAEMRHRLCVSWRPNIRFWSYWQGLIEVQRLTSAIFEQLDRIDNPLNLTGDSFLAEMYELVSELLTIKEEENAVRELLERVKDLESTIAERSATARADFLALVGIVVAFEYVTSGLSQLFETLASWAKGIWSLLL